MIKILKRLPIKIKLLCFMAIFFGILRPFFAMTVPTATRQFITALINDGHKKEIEVFIFKSDWVIGTFNTSVALWIIMGITFMFATILILVAYISGILATKVQTQGTYYLRKMLFEHTLNLSRKGLDSISVSKLITLFNNDISKIQDGFRIFSRGIFNTSFLVIWGFIFALFTNLWLSISIAIIVPFIIAAASFAIFKLFPLYRKENYLIKKLNETIKENFNVISLVKSYNLELNQYEKFKNATVNLEKVSKQSTKYNAFTWPLIDLIVLLGNTVLFIIIALLIRRLATSDVKKLVGDIYQFSTYLGMISRGIYMFLFFTDRLFRANISSKRIIKVLKMKSEIENISSKKKVKSGKIEFKNVSFKLQNKLILDDINFVINPYESVGIIGKTGSGKTTIAKLIAKEYVLENNSGKVLIDDENICEIDTNDFFDNIGYVFQKPILLSGTIRENIAYSGSNYTDDEIKKVLKLSSADFVFNLQNGLDHKILARGSNLSGGQRQRLSIAQNLIKEPKILILDDATSALDNKTDKKVRDNILTKTKKKTLIIISQRINSIKDCDKIIVLDKGKINGIGKHDELIETNAIYNSLYKYQQAERN